jgi:hypothetical protein
VLVSQIFRGQRRPESLIQIRRQDLHRFLFDGLRDPLIRWFPTQPVNNSLVSAFLQRVHQPLDLPHAQPQLLGRLLLRD